MNEPTLPRREFLELLAGAFVAPVIDWQVLPTGQASSRPPFDYDAIVIGSGLGGLSCAAAFARQGFRPLDMTGLAAEIGRLQGARGST